MTADELKALRKRLGITQARMGALAMVTKRTVQNWEYGSYPIPAYREKLLRSAARRLRAGKEKENDVR